MTLPTDEAANRINEGMNNLEKSKKLWEWIIFSIEKNPLVFIIIVLALVIIIRLIFKIKK